MKQDNIDRIMGMWFNDNMNFVMDGALFRPYILTTHSKLNSDFTRASTLANPPSDDPETWKSVVNRPMCDEEEYKEAVKQFEDLLNKFTYETKTNFNMPDGMVAEIGSLTDEEDESKILELYVGAIVALGSDFQALFKTVGINYETFCLTVTLKRDNEPLYEQSYYERMNSLAELLSVLTPDTYRSLLYRNRYYAIDKALILNYQNAFTPLQTLGLLSVNLMNSDIKPITVATAKASDGSIYTIDMELTVNPIEDIRRGV